MSQVRSCTNGTLSGSAQYQYAVCTGAGSAPPHGAHDGALCEITNGWAQDVDAPEAALTIHFYIDGPAGSGPVAGVATANQYRGDLCTAIGSCSHGFSFDIPAQFKDGGSHTVYAYAIDTTDPVNNNALLDNSPHTFQCVTASATKNNSLASALTALESALQAIRRLLGQ